MGIFNVKKCEKNKHLLFKDFVFNIKIVEILYICNEIKVGELCSY